MYFTALFPYVAITGLLIVAAKLDGAADGISYYIKPPEDMSKLFNFSVSHFKVHQSDYGLKIYLSR